MRAQCSSSSASRSSPSWTRSPRIRAPAARDCASPNALLKELPHDRTQTVAVVPPPALARGARIRGSGDLRSLQGARPVRAPREAERAARLARDGLGAPATRAKLLVLERVRRARRQREAADESAANPGRPDRPAVKQRPSESSPGTKTYRWRSAAVLGLVVLGAAELGARAVEMEVLD